MEHCPGARAVRQPKPEIFTCPRCGGEIEIWTDEISGTCARCGEVLYREGMMSCLEWCEYARECVGGEAYDRFLKGKTVGVKRRLLQELEKRLAGQGELDRAMRRLQAVERAACRLGAEGFIVIPAALLLMGLEGGDREKTLLSAGLSLDHARRVEELADRFRRAGKKRAQGERNDGSQEQGPPDPNLRALQDAFTA
jgi:hypothetical protein